jgi:hypothetical protein
MLDLIDDLVSVLESLYKKPLYEADPALEVMIAACIENDNYYAAVCLLNGEIDAMRNRFIDYEKLEF